MDDTKNVRHGDVNLLECPAPDRAKLKPAPAVLAHGEATGHRHEILEGTVWCDADGQLWVEAGETTRIAHLGPQGELVEHGEIPLVKDAWYRVVPQNEYQPEGWTRVTD